MKLASFRASTLPGRMAAICDANKDVVGFLGVRLLIEPDFSFLGRALVLPFCSRRKAVRLNWRLRVL